MITSEKFLKYKNSKEIVPSDRIRFEEMGDNRFRMTIENLTSEDAGLYACKAVNTSKDRKRVSDDRFAPIFNVPLHDRRIPEGNNMIVECFVNAKPRADIKW
uniref:Ig-like domain-containing protein n=1 Tax=Romanomermis culicivorax TaxID=13658 RepID=A0A915I8J6_ROMCU